MSRALTGFFASGPLTNSGAVLADMWVFFGSTLPLHLNFMLLHIRPEHPVVLSKRYSKIDTKLNIRETFRKNWIEEEDYVFQKMTGH
jgi:hypothetical protein